jgi:hypothetical protein
MLLSELRKRILRESGPDLTKFTFEVYGPNDETYTVYANFNRLSPYEIEVWKATGPDGEEVEVDELEAQGHDLNAKAFEKLDQIGVDDSDPPGTGWDERY